ncbi:hypothetical protein FE257_006359 [Aspergillus nanangensis]|uniref:Rho-GAP domain-containing protein n=1 Tax=Aspergillus nanangensis TaxID=2582783 RepID=A0AAD4GZ08_ASPNN|nr:hypothetical protein FE257_006359 [Aspergillus nanangensis]
MRLSGLFSKSADHQEGRQVSSEEQKSLPSRGQPGAKTNPCGNQENTAKEVARSKIGDIKRAHPVFIESTRYNSSVATINQVGQDSDNSGIHPTVSAEISATKPHCSQSATEGRRPLRRSRRLKSFLARLESHNPLHQGPSPDRLKGHDQHDNLIPEQNIAQADKGDRVSGPLQTLNPCNISAEIEARKVSGKSLMSMDSELTSATIRRHPSKRTLTPITLPRRENSCENPFDQSTGNVERVVSSDPFADPLEVSVHSADCTGSEHSDMPNRALGILSFKHMQKNPFSTDSQSSSQNTSHLPNSSNSSSWSTHTDQRAAVIACNDLATKLHLTALGPKKYSNGADAEMRLEQPLPKRRSRIFGKIQRMRSSFHIGTQSGASQEPKLRRVRTFAAFPNRSYEMNSLNGRSLETLARLGGHSFLNLPADFAPSALRLPTCFVAIIGHLRNADPTVRNLFIDAGDIKTTERVYAYFANQVLSADKDKAIIEVTLRRDEMLNDPVGLLNRGTPVTKASQALGIAWVLKALLEGLPGGILGSLQLYQILVNICSSHISGSALKQGSCLDGLSPTTYLRTKAIGLAMVALLDALQLNLVCAVFGLCAVLMHETERRIELGKQGFKGSIGISRSGVGAGILSLDRLGRIFGPLLVNHEEDCDATSSRNAERKVEGQRVAQMMIENWRGVSRQLRVLESRRPMAQRGGLAG